MGLKVYTTTDNIRHFQIPAMHQITPALLFKAFKFGVADKPKKSAGNMSRTRLLEYARQITLQYGEMCMSMDDPVIHVNDEYITSKITSMFPELVEPLTAQPYFPKKVVVDGGVKGHDFSQNEKFSTEQEITDFVGQL